eukprot:Polyplicarium_translucidae@DN3225_c0_g2_i1.p2
MRHAQQIDKGLQMVMHEYSIVGRGRPTPKDLEPSIFRMQVFARNHVVAKSKFWYFMKRLNKCKRAHGEVLEVTRVPVKNTRRVKNYAIWLRYDSRTGTHNMYKEFRDVTKCGAVSQMYSEMAGRHRARAHCISIMKIAEIPNEMCKRPHITQLQKKQLKFPQCNMRPLGPKSSRPLFCWKRPGTFHEYE